MKLRDAAVFLMISSILWTLFNLYWAVKQLMQVFSYGSENFMNAILSLLMVIIPISLLVLSITLLKYKPSQASGQTEEINE
jgi:hypothetical protein